jgi:hypothetical protein
MNLLLIGDMRHERERFDSAYRASDPFEGTNGTHHLRCEGSRHQVPADRAVASPEGRTQRARDSDRRRGIRRRAFVPAPQHPEWQDKEPFKSVLAGDLKRAFAGGAPSLIELMAAGHSNMTIEEFDLILNKWLTTAKHPTRGRLYTEMAYQPASP